MKLMTGLLGVWLSFLPAAVLQDGPQVLMVAEFDEV